MGLWTTHKTEYVSEFGPLKVGGIYQVPDTHKYPKEEHYGIFLYGRNPKPASSKNVRKMRNWDVVRVFVVRVVVRLPFSSFPASLTTPNRSLTTSHTIPYLLHELYYNTNNNAHTQHTHSTHTAHTQHTHSYTAHRNTLLHSTQKHTATRTHCTHCTHLHTAHTQSV